MSDLTQHLGEIMGQTPAEKAEAAALAEYEMSSAPAETVADAGGAVIMTPEGTAGAIPLEGDSFIDLAEAAVITVHPQDVYAFPFTADEVFGILPQSLASKAQAAWEVLHFASGETNAITLAAGGLMLGLVFVAAISTVRVWRRGAEFVVATYGDRMAEPGARYTVRQDPPIIGDREPHGAVLAAAPADSDLLLPPPAAENGDALLETEAPEPEAAAPGVSADPVLAEAPLQPAMEETLTTTTSEGRAAEPSRPRRLRRKLFRRMAPTVTFAGAFHGSYGSFQAADRVFARDYLRQTNEAFEKAYLKGGVLRLDGPLKLSENVRGERLFMMATRASFEDPQTALAALWQAIEEEPADAVAWLRLAHFYLELGDFDHATRVLEPLLAAAETQDHDIIIAAAANSLGQIAAQRGEHEKGRAYFEQALNASDRLGNGYLGAVASANLGLLLASRGRGDEAIDALKRGIEGFEAAEELVPAARTKLVLGALLSGMAERTTAHRLWDEAAGVFKKVGYEDEAERAAKWARGEGAPNGVTV